MRGHTMVKGGYRWKWEDCYAVCFWEERTLLEGGDLLKGSGWVGAG